MLNGNFKGEYMFDWNLKGVCWLGFKDGWLIDVYIPEVWLIDYRYE